MEMKIAMDSFHQTHASHNKFSTSYTMRSSCLRRASRALWVRLIRSRTWSSTKSPLSSSKLFLTVKSRSMEAMLPNCACTGPTSPSFWNQLSLETQTISVVEMETQQVNPTITAPKDQAHLKTAETILTLTMAAPRQTRGTGWATCI